MEPFTINRPVSLRMEPKDVALVLDALAELPYKLSASVVQSIVTQVKAQHEAPAVPEPAARGPKLDDFPLGDPTLEERN